LVVTDGLNVVRTEPITDVSDPSGALRALEQREVLDRQSKVAADETRKDHRIAPRRQSDAAWDRVAEWAVVAGGVDAGLGKSVERQDLVTGFDRCAAMETGKVTKPGRADLASDLQTRGAAEQLIHPEAHAAESNGPVICPFDVPHDFEDGSP
jgi:hypothetical protein